jgi:large subunit ribosomal protein L25
MPDRPKLPASSRTVTGKAVAKLRRTGQLPAVVISRGSEPVNLTLDAKGFDDLRRHTGASTLIDLTVDGGTSRPILVHGIQVHPVTRRPLHVDLLAVRMGEEISVDVPLVSRGYAPALDHGGTLLLSTETVKVRALPDHLPSSIEVDVTTLETFEASIHVRDLPVPEGVTIVADPDEMVARVMPPRVEAEPEVPVLEGEEAEQAAAAAEQGAETAATAGEGQAADEG